MSEVDKYLKNVTPSQKVELERIRAAIKKAVPEAEESISYGIPTFKLNKRPLIYYGAFKGHMSLFPMGEPVKQMGEKLSKFKTSKGTLQFTEKQPVTDDLLKEIIEIRLKSIVKE